MAYLLRYSNGGVSLDRALEMEGEELRLWRKDFEWLLSQEYPDKS